MWIWRVSSRGGWELEVQSWGSSVDGEPQHLLGLYCPLAAHAAWILRLGRGVGVSNRDLEKPEESQNQVTKVFNKEVHSLPLHLWEK